MPFTNPIIAGTTLIRDAIKSPDYAAGSAGWSINRDGSVEFNDATVRGSLSAANGDVTVTDAGMHIALTDGSFDVTDAGAIASSNDGSSVAMSVDAVIGSLVKVQPPNPGGATPPSYTYGFVAGGVEDLTSYSPYMLIESPNIAGRPNGVIKLVGSSKSGTPEITSLMHSPGGWRFTGDLMTYEGLPILTGYNGSVNVTTNASGVGTAVVNFPTAFAAPPNVQLTLVSGISQAVHADVFVLVLSASQMTVRLDLATAAAVIIAIHWQATPMQ